ncbi:putative E3 ubiquitin-protein ligase UBR7 isoform X2 [Halyomorpha halys]|uniref:putative E3 ubiquitin-protein ligase UBR7 isoform X2 n=1 Tax=Halyomorpha halys TaxID=286706 RepID=UPI000D0C80AB|nr:putative E3 ubiquitin-protein ligase UBR7 isoform X2 [Halyomorpha halys]
MRPPNALQLLQNRLPRVSTVRLDSDMAESSSSEVKDVSDDNTLTLVDFLEEELQLESDANAVLGPSDDKNCTYNRGYLQRQAVYACMTCTPQDSPSSKPAGICLACSYHCHEDHELVELYTKRFFRCDCGNNRFNGKKCNLEPNKTEENEKNVYNQNFRGLYCFCSRPYPDPEDDVSDEMLQCIICEDWYHTRHLKSQVPPETNYAELICGQCMDKLPFLSHYLGLAVFPTSRNSKDNKEDVNIEVDALEGTSSSHVLPDTNSKEELMTIDRNDKTSEEEKTSLLEDKENSQNEAVINVFPTSNESNVVSTVSKDECKLENTRPLSRTEQSAIFWPSNFRSALCCCAKCQDLYAKHNVPWIIDEKDTVQSYEGIGKETQKNSQYEAGLEALARLDRFRQVEAIQNYNDLKSNLSDFLIKFVRQKRVVKKEDIDEFFTDMQARKRQKVGTPPYTCH